MNYIKAFCDFIGNLWYELSVLEVPILGIPFTTFFISIFVVNFSISLFRFIFGKLGDDDLVRSRIRGNNERTSD